MTLKSYRYRSDFVNQCKIIRYFRSQLDDKFASILKNESDRSWYDLTLNNKAVLLYTYSYTFFSFFFKFFGRIENFQFQKQMFEIGSCLLCKNIWTEIFSTDYSIRLYKCIHITLSIILTI